jgi:hypothetical protein
MSRRTRTLQLFATPEEMQSLVAQLAAGGLFIFAVGDGGLVAVDPMDVVDRQRLFVGEASFVPGSGHREPARHGLVMLDMPSRSNRLVVASRIPSPV